MVRKSRGGWGEIEKEGAVVGLQGEISIKTP